MKTTTSTGLVVLLALAVTAGAPGPLPVAHADPPATSASAAPSASASAAAGKKGIAVSAYAWPGDVTPEPKEEEWAGATDLEVVDSSKQNVWLGGLPWTTCTQQVVGSWVRLSCTPHHDEGDDILIGVIWGLAGDLGKVKGKLTPASELPRYKKPPTDNMEALTRRMGASSTVTFPVSPGSSLMLQIDRMGWDEGYDGSSVFTRAGMMVDVSWALGEKYPTILYR